MKDNIYNICMTIAAIAITLCITYISIEMQSKTIAWFFLIPAFMETNMVFDINKKDGE